MPRDGHHFLLFHQPSEKRLEAIRLTGSDGIPVGAHYFIVENLKKVKRKSTVQKWSSASIVDAVIHNAQLIDVNSGK